MLKNKVKTNDITHAYNKGVIFVNNKYNNVMDIINDTIQNLTTSFDFSYCIVVNVLAYILITCFIDIARGNITRFMKRFLLVISMIAVGIIYYLVGVDVKLIVNSAIITPVSWSWIIKPILAKFGYDYKDIDKRLN